MLNYIWAILIVVSFFCAIATGRIEQLSQSVVEGAGKAVELSISMLGLMCAWTGFMKIAEAGGITAILSRVFFPLIKRFFPGYQKESPVFKAISMNMAANLLGLGNAATPLGIAAMKEMKRLHPHDTEADNNMVMFVVWNTASIQLIPTTMGILRSQYGSSSPFDILPAVWVASIGSLFIGVLIAKLLAKKRWKNG